MASSSDAGAGGAASGFAAMLGRALRVAVVAFVVLQIKELKDAGRFDTVGTAIDGGLIGGGSFLLDALMSLMRRARGSSPAASATSS